MVGSRVAVCCAWILALALVSVQSEEMTFGILGKSAVIKCPLDTAGEVEWYDWVYSEDGIVPATLYKDGQVMEDSYRTGRLNVNAQKGTITISDLVSDDAGDYFCKNENDEKTLFKLAVGTMPECSGDNLSDLRPMEEVSLECEMSYSGTAPVMQWLREYEVIESKDDTQIDMAKESATVIVEPEMDGQTFTCRATLGEVVEECDLQFVVKYAVQDIMFDPEKAAYTPGSEFICSAKGNPTPSVTVTLPDGEKKMGQGQVKVVIPDEWVGQSKTIECEANNTHDGLEKKQSTSFDFDVAPPPKPEEPAESSGDNGVEPPAEAGTQTAAIVAGVVIGAVVLVVIIVAVVCVKKRQSKPPKGSKPVPTKEDGKADNIA